LIEIRRTSTYATWFAKLKDTKVRASVADRIQRLVEGNPGDARNVGSGVVELRINAGPGYRVYYIQRGQRLILLLCGGAKSTQTKDIERAKALAQEYNQE
jgi:putative addiction module killer protein